MKVCVLPERMCVRSVGGAAPHMTHLLHLGGPWTFCARPNPDSHPSIMEPLHTDTAILPESLKMPKSGKVPGSKAWYVSSRKDFMPGADGYSGLDPSAY